MAGSHFSPHPFSLRQLQYAIAVADARSFGRAARLCGVSQPSLSAQLALLERMLGVRLFERDRRSVLITPAGEEAVARARRVLIESDDLLDAARRRGDPLAGMLRLGVIPTISPYLLPSVVPAIRRAHPQLLLRWTEDKTETLLRELREGVLDAALVALEVALGELEREVIGRDPFVLAAPRAHRLAKSATPVTFAELRGASVLLLDDGHCLRDQALAICSSASTEELGFRATSLPTLAQMVSAGAGITLLPRMAVSTESHRCKIAVRPLADQSAYRTIGLVWRPTSPIGAALRKVAATIRATYAAKTTERRSARVARSGRVPRRR